MTYGELVDFLLEINTYLIQHGHYCKDSSHETLRSLAERDPSEARGKKKISILEDTARRSFDTYEDERGSVAYLAEERGVPPLSMNICDVCPIKRECTSSYFRVYYDILSSIERDSASGGHNQRIPTHTIAEVNKLVSTSLVHSLVNRLSNMMLLGDISSSDIVDRRLIESMCTDASSSVASQLKP